MDANFAASMEDKGFDKLVEFNSKLKLDNLGRTPSGYTSDASGTSFCGDVNIEIKVRNMEIDPTTLTITGHTKDDRSYTADTLYIESHKIADLLLDHMCDGKVPLYVNFLNGGYCVVFNLSKLKHRPRKEAKRIYSKLYQGFELAKRQLLDLRDAYIYKIMEDGRWMTIKY